MTVYPARGPRYRQLPLWRDAQRLLLEVEQAVRGFSRYHKYSLGSELRQQTMNICRLVARAAQEQSVQRRLNMVEQLVWAVEDLKIRLQLGKWQPSLLPGKCGAPARSAGLLLGAFCPCTKPKYTPGRVAESSMARLLAAGRHRERGA